MANYISNKTRFKQKRGRGNGEDYKPWLQTSDFNSKGTCVNPIDWKTGRTVELLSLNEYRYWLIRMFDDNVIEIKEQYPLLPVEVTKEISKALDIRYPAIRKGSDHVMTTDFLITTLTGKEAISIKPKDKINGRTKDLLSIERLYWEEQGIPYKIVTEEMIDVIKAENIRQVSVYFDKSMVFDDISCLKHLIATKQIIVDITKPLNYQLLLKNDSIRKEVQNAAFRSF